MKNYIPCCICAKKAYWSYDPGKESYCENCVPRGCSCNRELKMDANISVEEELALYNSDFAKIPLIMLRSWTNWVDNNLAVNSL